jgi:hypothetical protein
MSRAALELTQYSVEAKVAICIEVAVSLVEAVEEHIRLRLSGCHPHSGLFYFRRCCREALAL